MQIPGLVESDTEKVRKILEDIQVSVSCEIGIGGSLAQRMLSSEIAERLRGKKLHDVDLLLIGAGDTAPETPELRKRFRVVEVLHEGCWYYGMVHRATGMWVDLFGQPYKQNFALIELGGTQYRASTIEGQLLYLARDILHRVKTGFPVRKKWIEKLKLLQTISDINYNQVQDEFSAHVAYFQSVVPQNYTLPDTAQQYITFASNQKASSVFWDKIFLVWWYFCIRKTRQ